MHATHRSMLVIGLACVAWGAALACGKETPAAAADSAIRMTVTAAGFDPDHIKVKKNQPVKLLITRTSDETCAKEIVIDEYKIHAELPLNKAVAVAFTPNKSGEIKYGCGMSKMVFGTLTIE